MSKIEQKIPEGWSVKTLGEFIVFKNGLNTDKEAYGTGTKFVNTMDIFNNNYLYEKNVIGSVKISDKELHKNNVIYGDILFNRTSEIPQEIAFSTIYLDTKNIITFGGFIIRGRPQKNILNPFFSIYCFKSSYFRKEAIRRCQGAIRANIGQNDLSKIKILLPPLPEQEKIAGILSCWDDGIEKLSALIEKKKIQKKALMQQLLTGKHRLKGFSTPWHEVRLGGVCKTFSGGTPSAENQTYYGGNIPFIRSGEIHLDRTDLFITNKALENTSAKLVSKGDLLYALYGATSGEVDISKIDGAINQAILCIRSQHMDLYFLCCLLQNKKEKILRKYLQGGQGNLSAEIIKSLMIPEPDLAEQKAIAKILSKADEEIELLNKKLEAFKQEKKALMQQLLTGKIRVKVN